MVQCPRLLGKAHFDGRCGTPPKKVNQTGEKLCRSIVGSHWLWGRLSFLLLWRFAHFPRIMHTLARAIGVALTTNATVREQIRLETKDGHVRRRLGVLRWENAQRPQVMGSVTTATSSAKTVTA